MLLGGRSIPEVARRGRGAEERTPNAEVALGRNIVKRVSTAKQSPHAPSAPESGQAGQGSIAPMETRTGRLSRTRTTIRAMTRAWRIGGSLPAGEKEAMASWGVGIRLRVPPCLYATILIRRLGAGRGTAVRSPERALDRVGSRRKHLLLNAAPAVLGHSSRLGGRLGLPGATRARGSHAETLGWGGHPQGLVGPEGLCSARRSGRGRPGPPRSRPGPPRPGAPCGGCCGAARSSRWWWETPGR
jgi:hypothetical protein